MMFPINPFDMGVGLSPIMRNLFFGRSKGLFDIGPTYTQTTFIPQVLGDAWDSYGDMIGGIPGADFVYRSLAGKAPPKVKP